MPRHKTNFNNINWKTYIKGVKNKTYKCGDKQIHLIEFTNDKIIYKKDEGVFIPNGAEHKHRAVANVHVTLQAELEY